MNGFCVEFKIQRLSGSVTINDNPASLTTPLKTGDTITAIGKKSYIQIKNDLGSTFLIKDGKMKLAKFEKEESVVSLIKGKFYHYFNNKKRKGRFKVKTKHAVMGVRGTKYMVESNNKYDYLCVCEGSVFAMRNKNDNAITVNRGEDLFYHLGKKKAHKQSASEQMMSMATMEFKLMGHPVK